MYEQPTLSDQFRRSSKSECQITFHCFLQRRRWLEKYYAYTSFTELLFVVSGEGSFSFNQEQSPLRRGDLVIIPPYTEHTERSSQNHPLEYYVLGIDGISFLSQKTENAHRYSAILSMIPVFMNCSARCSTKSGPHNTVLRPSASICLRFWFWRSYDPNSSFPYRSTRSEWQRNVPRSKNTWTQTMQNTLRWTRWPVWHIWTNIIWCTLLQICRTLPNSVSESDASEACTAFAEKYQLFDFWYCVLHRIFFPVLFYTDFPEEF